MPENFEKRDDRTGGELAELTKEIFGDERALDELRQELSIPERGIECSLEKVNFDKEENFNGLQVRAYFTEKINDASSPIGYFVFSFGKHCTVPQELYVEFGELVEEKQGKGLGIELECRIENFCRQHNIWDIYNTPTSAPAGVFGKSKFIGGYVWACMGFNFDKLKEDAKNRMESWRNDIIEFAQNKKIFILFDPLELTRPFEFANAMGLDEDNHIVNLGKKFFIDGEVKWRGHKDLRFNSQDTKDFVDYLMLRNMFDWVEEYFIKPLNPERDQKFIDYLIPKLAEKNKVDLFTKHFPQNS